MIEYIRRRPTTFASIATALIAMVSARLGLDVTTEEALTLVALVTFVVGARTPLDVDGEEA